MRMAKPNKERGLQGSGEFVNKVVCQTAVILVLSFALGLAFNASNPIGIAWSGTSKTAAAQSPPPALSPAAPTPAPPTQVIASTSPPRPGVASVATIRPNAPQSPVIWSSAAQGATNPPSATASSTNTTPTPAAPTRYALATTWAKSKPLVTTGKAVLVDARPKPVYEAGHIPSAVSLPEASTIEEFKAFQTEHGTNSHVIVYCSSTSCSISARVANRLVHEFNFREVEFMTGGYQEWQQAELAQNIKTNTNEPAVKP